jgi:hypothetical protein
MPLKASPLSRGTRQANKGICLSLKVISLELVRCFSVELCALNRHAAASVTVKPKAGKTSSRYVSPGWLGGNDLFIKQSLPWHVVQELAMLFLTPVPCSGGRGLTFV